MPSRNSNARALLALLAGGISLLGVGCGEKKVQAAAPVSAPPAKAAIETPPPSTTAPDTTAMPPVASQTPAPEIQASSETPPPMIAPAKPAPKPQKPVLEPEPATVAEDHTRPRAPQISPQLTDDQRANYQRGIAEDIGVAEGNLKQSDGKRLNAQQTDLADKIRSFRDQSASAVKEGDLARAKNLAQKARL